MSIAKAAPSQNGAVLFTHVEQDAQYEAIRLLPGYTLSGPRACTSLEAISQQFAETLQAEERPRTVLEGRVQALKAWRECILTTYDGSGYLMGDSRMPHFQELLPVRIMVNDAFEKDCLDSNDLLELFLCCHEDSAVLCPTASVTLLR